MYTYVYIYIYIHIDKTSVAAPPQGGMSKGGSGKHPLIIIVINIISIICIISIISIISIIILNIIIIKSYQRGVQWKQGVVVYMYYIILGPEV